MPKISPVLENITLKGRVVAELTKTAFWGYNNTHLDVQTVGVGQRNKFTPDPIDQGQTAVFQPGRHRDTFKTPLPASGNLVWTLTSPDNTRRTATAGQPALGIVPYVSSVYGDGTGPRIIYFGVRNPNAFTIKVVDDDFTVDGIINTLKLPIRLQRLKDAGSPGIVFRKDYIPPGDTPRIIAVNSVELDEFVQWRLMGTLTTDDPAYPGVTRDPYP